MISCDKLVNTRAMTIEAADTLIFLGNEEPLERGSLQKKFTEIVNVFQTICDTQRFLSQPLSSGSSSALLTTRPPQVSSTTCT